MFDITNAERNALKDVYTTFRARFLAYDAKNQVVNYYNENSSLVLEARRGPLYTIGTKIPKNQTMMLSSLIN